MNLPTPVAVAALAVTLSPPALAVDGIDSDLSDYSPMQGVSGNRKASGSDTMNNLMAM
jgi:hypothetical protein